MNVMQLWWHCNDLAHKNELAVLVELVSAAEAYEGDKGQLGVGGGIDQAHNLVLSLLDHKDYRTIHTKYWNITKLNLHTFLVIISAHDLLSSS